MPRFVLIIVDAGGTQRAEYSEHPDAMSAIAYACVLVDGHDQVTVGELGDADASARWIGSWRKDELGPTWEPIT